MTTIDLGAPAPPSDGVLDALPRRVTLTLPELQLVAERAGGAPLPFVVADPADRAGASSIEGRLGATRGTQEDRAYRTVLAGLHDPVDSLTRRGLIGPGGSGVETGLAGAVGLLATPVVAVDVDVAVERLRAKAWHRQSGDAVAALSTGDGIVFELAWFPTAVWPAELARVAALPEDVVPRESQVPPGVELPYELLDAATEALTSGRPDLLPVLVEQYAAVRLPDGSDLGAAESVGLLQALGAETQGRLRVLVADVEATRSTVVGVRSWVLLADGWRSLHAHADDAARVRLSAVGAADLAADLAPVLAEVVR